MSCEIDDSLHAQVKLIVDELEAAVSGSLYEIDGNHVVIDDMDEWKKEQYEKEAGNFRKEHPERDFNDCADEAFKSYGSYAEYMEAEIGTVDDVDDPDEVSLDEYIEDSALGDVRFEVDSSKTLLGGKVLFCCGGPTVWVADDEVRGYWGASRCEMPLDSETRSALFSWFSEMWEAAGGR